MSAPKRIIVHRASERVIWAEAGETGNPDYGTVAYVRADLADKMLAALKGIRSMCGSNDIGMGAVKNIDAIIAEVGEHTE